MINLIGLSNNAPNKQVDLMVDHALQASHRCLGPDSLCDQLALQRMCRSNVHESSQLLPSDQFTCKVHEGTVGEIDRLALKKCREHWHGVDDNEVCPKETDIS